MPVRLQTEIHMILKPSHCRGILKRRTLSVLLETSMKGFEDLVAGAGHL